MHETGTKSISWIKKDFVKALMVFMPIIESGRARQNWKNQSYKFRYITLKTWNFLHFWCKVLDKTYRQKA